MRQHTNLLFGTEVFVATAVDTVGHTHCRPVAEAQKVLPPLFDLLPSLASMCVAALTRMGAVEMDAEWADAAAQSAIVR